MYCYWENKDNFEGGTSKISTIIWMNMFYFVWSTIHNCANTCILLEHSSSSMRFRFIWPSMDACPPVGPVYIADWKLQLATLGSGDWWLWFIETFRSPPIRLVAFSMPGHLDFSMKQGWCWHYCNFYEKKKVFSMIRKCPK